MTFRIAQISDSHLSAEKPFFVGNFERLGEVLRASRPDLVVNTGDVSLNGAEGVADLQAAKSLRDAIGLPYRTIPGNHDIGDDQASAHQHAPSDASRDRYVAVFGEDWWSHDVPGWRLIGVNSLIMGSELSAAIRQREFIAEAARSAANRSILLFIHKPLYLDTRTEQLEGARFLRPAPRGELFDAFAAREPAIVACGHVHQFRDVRLEGIHHIWAPATSFVVPAEYQVTVGERMIGYVEHALHADGTHDCRVVRMPALACNSLADFPDAYGDFTKLMPKVTVAA